MAPLRLAALLAVACWLSPSAVVVSGRTARASVLGGRVAGLTSDTFSGGSWAAARLWLLPAQHACQRGHTGTMHAVTGVVTSGGSALPDYKIHTQCALCFHQTGGADNDCDKLDMIMGSTMVLSNRIEAGSFTVQIETASEMNKGDRTQVGGQQTTSAMIPLDTIVVHTKLME